MVQSRETEAVYKMFVYYISHLKRKTTKEFYFHKLCNSSALHIKILDVTKEIVLMQV